MKPGGERSDLGVVPEEWDVSTIGELMTLLNGRAFKPEEWRPRGLPIIRIQNLNDVTADFNHCDGRVEERHLVRKGDLLFAWSGTTGTSFGARVWMGPDAALNQHIFKVRLNSTRLLHPFALFALRRAQDDIEAQAHGFKSSFVHVKKADLFRISILIPPHAEQHALAQALGDVDALLQGLDRLVAKKRDLRQAILQRLLTGRDRLPGFIGDWSTCRIGDIAAVRSEKNLQGWDLPVLTCSKHLGFVDSLGFFKNQVFADDRTGYKIIRRGEIGYPANHVEEGSIGLQDRYDMALVSPIYVVFAVGKGVSSVFLHRLLKLDSFRQQFRVTTAASVDRRGSLRWPAFSQITVRVPPVEEQQAIVAVISDVDAELAALEARREKTRLLKQGMMQELLTGRIRLV